MRRGVASLIIGGALWFLSIVIGSEVLRLLGAGFLVLPALAWCWIHLAKPRVTVQRHLSSAVVPVGTPIEVTLNIRSTSNRPAPYVLLDDIVPPSVGSPVRLCIEGVPGGAGRRAVYEVVPTQRGRMKLGPSIVRIADPFLLSRTTSRTAKADTLIVTPKVESLHGIPEAGRRGAYGSSATRRSRGQSEEFAAIRPYAVGDDLRRVHWSSVARTGELMLRQDEARQGAGTTIFIDTRSSALGASGGAGFEAAISAAASLAAHLHRGAPLHLATSERAAVAVGSQDLLITLSSVADWQGLPMGAENLTTFGDPTIVAVLAPPTNDELAALVRSGARAATRIACLVVPPSGTPEGARGHERRSPARSRLRAAGWTVIDLDANTSLVEPWNSALRPHATSA